MMVTRLCDACGMEYDWEPVRHDGQEYCCEACARGERCECPQHDDVLSGEPIAARTGLEGYGTR